MNRKHVAGWVLYDFANSVYPAVIIAVVFSVYFGENIVGNEPKGAGDFWWGMVASTSALFVALSSPLLGSIADRAGVRKRMLFIFAYLCIVAVALFPTIQPGMIWWGFCLAVLANIGFEGSLVYYNAYLPDIAPADRQGFVSGLGFGVGYAGSIAGLLIALLFVRAGRFDLVWYSVAAFFALFSIPAFLWMPADRRGERTIVQAAADGLIGFKRLVGEVLRERELRRFLLSYFFFIDGVLTTMYFSSRFARETLQFSINGLIYLFIVVQISALIGALALARPTDVWGPKRVITYTLFLWTAVVIASFFVQSKGTFVVIALVAGFGLGSIQSASRTLMARLIPKGKESQMFGFYAFCGKSSSVIGPIVFGTVSARSGGDQRLAILSVGALFFIGLILLQRVKAPTIPSAE
ncbi:MAG: MFS transporter [Planctomycetota bacterium]|nr:MFS transporter [Planctomycetota bacterium]